ncbi:MAG TPA: histidine kinase [Vicinamibacterales bacterium]|nr:histidine kinase [Vicinamibacterales bacterium]
MPLGLARRPDLHGAIDEGEQHRLEYIIAIARAFLAGAALLATYLAPSEPTTYSSLAYSLLVFYDIYAAILLLLFRFGPLSAARLGLLLHTIDLVWAVSLTFLTEGPNSPFFALFVFVLLAAACRWGFRETILTGFIVVILFLFEAVGLSLGFVASSLELQALIMRCAYFLLATFLLAYLSEQAKGLRAEATVVNRLVDRVHVRDGLAANMQAVLGDLLKLFGGRQIVVVLEEVGSRRIVLWEVVMDGSTEAPLRFRDLEPAQARDYLFPLPADVAVWQVTRAARRGNVRMAQQALNGESARVRGANILLPTALQDVSWGTVLGLTIEFGEEWTGRLLLLDPTARPAGESRLKFLQKLMLHVSPVLHNVYLLRRLRLRIGAIERARVARELHDSAVQSLIGLEMQLDVMRRDVAVSPEHSKKLADLQDVLKQEILSIRDLMEQLRPRPADPQHLVERLKDIADRFERDTGIGAKFVSKLDRVDLPSEVCGELTRIVQEGLVNVRKHSGASHVLVHLQADDWSWHLTISDDGRGFGFVGSLSHSQAAARRLGPKIIRERVEAIGGKMLTVSGPDGARLEIVGRIQKPWIVTSGA